MELLTSDKNTILFIIKNDSKTVFNVIELHQQIVEVRIIFWHMAYLVIVFPF